MPHTELLKSLKKHNDFSLTFNIGSSLFMDIDTFLQGFPKAIKVKQVKHETELTLVYNNQFELIHFGFSLAQAGFSLQNKIIF